MPAQQVFLSYSHRDDEPYGPQQRRWVEEFERALRESIGQRVGPGRVDVWRDIRRLAGNELFDTQIEQQLNRSTIFVTVPPVRPNRQPRWPSTLPARQAT
jgi:hypothetical protein